MADKFRESQLNLASWSKSHNKIVGALNDNFDELLEPESRRVEKLSGAPILGGGHTFIPETSQNSL